jgi:predicted aminopeptidase
MTRWLSRSVAVGSIVAVAGCASIESMNRTVSITKSRELVANCQEVGEVSVDSNTRDDGVVARLSSAARRKGANYVLVASDGARSGVAYRCEMPAATTHGS